MTRAFSNTALCPGAAIKGSRLYPACPLFRSTVITALCRLLVGMPRGHVSGNWMALQTQKSPRCLPTRALPKLQRLLAPAHFSRKKPKTQCVCIKTGHARQHPRCHETFMVPR